MSVLGQAMVATELSDPFAFQLCELQNEVLPAWLRNCHLRVHYLCVKFLSPSGHTPPKSGKSQGVHPHPVACALWYVMLLECSYRNILCSSKQAFLSFQNLQNPIVNAKH